MLTVGLRGISQGLEDQNLKTKKYNYNLKSNDEEIHSIL
jgi:hypothetical protein